MEFGIPSRQRESLPLKGRVEPLRAEGSLTYLQFIRLVIGLWSEVHPDIPIRPTQSSAYAQYPVIVYGLEMRRPHAGETKPRIREELQSDGDTNFIVTGQRFENVVSFTVYTKGDPELAEEIIEAFEDFMLKYTGVFKRLGISDMVYGRRTPDAEETRLGEDTERRSVVYSVVTEKNQVAEVEKIKNILVTARLYIETNTVDNFLCREDDVADNLLTFVGAMFLQVGDRVVIKVPLEGVGGNAALPAGLHAGSEYRVVFVDGNTFKLETISRSEVIISSSGSGRIQPSTDKSFDETSSRIIDQMATPNY
jgi:hypothetical protein